MNLRQLFFACFVSMFALTVGSPRCLAQPGDAEYPIPIQERRKLTDSLQKSAEQLTQELVDAGSKRGGLHSRRGDAWSRLFSRSNMRSPMVLRVSIYPFISKPFTE